MSLSHEEVELLSTDPELLELRRELAAKRVADAQAELEHEELEAALDDQIEGPMMELEQEGYTWRAWSSSWSVVLEREKLLLKSLEKLAERLMWVEEDEEARRVVIEEQFNQSIESIAVVERKARRYLLESVAWAGDWMASRDAEWAVGRAAAAAQKHEICFAQAERRRADEDEIRRLERRELELTKSRHIAS